MSHFQILKLALFVYDESRANALFINEGVFGYDESIIRGDQYFIEFKIRYCKFFFFFFKYSWIHNSFGVNSWSIFLKKINSQLLVVNSVQITITM